MYWNLIIFENRSDNIKFHSAIEKTVKYSTLFLILVFSHISSYSDANIPIPIYDNYFTITIAMRDALTSKLFVSSHV